MPNTAPQYFNSLCRQWRNYRKLSQLELALAANVSQRHVSWLETGRSMPSREMVSRLSDAMEIPLRERNALFLSAGFAAAYRETPLNEPVMAPVSNALSRMLDHHDPLPALVVDRLWNVQKTNKAADLLLAMGGDPEAMLEELGGAGDFNLALLSLHPQGLRQFVTNWEQIAPHFINRLKCDALASGDSEVQARFAKYIELAGPIGDSGSVKLELMPVLPLELSFNGIELSLFSVITTFGTPQDITTDELRIEAFYPTDERTEEFFRQAARTSQ